MIASLFLASAVLVSSAQWIRIAVSDDNANLFEAQPSSVEVTGSNVNDGGTVASMISEQLCSALISAAGKQPSSKNSL